MFNHWHIELVNEDTELPAIQLSGYYAWRGNANAVAAAIHTELQLGDTATVIECESEDCHPTFHRRYMSAIANARS